MNITGDAILKMVSLIVLAALLATSGAAIYYRMQFLKKCECENTTIGQDTKTADYSSDKEKLMEMFLKCESLFQ